MITITFGLSNSVTKDVDSYPTVNSIIADPSLRQVLGFGDNVEARVNGVTCDVGQYLSDGDTVSLVTKANSKAV